MEQIRAEMRDQPWMLPAIDHSAVPIDLVRAEPKAGYYRVFSKQNFAAEDLNESIETVGAIRLIAAAKVYDSLHHKQTAIISFLV